MREWNLIYITLIFLLIIPSIHAQEIPTCEIVIMSDTPKINEGESFTIEGYLVGSGKIKFGYMSCIADCSTIFNELQWTGYDTYVGGTNILISYPLIPNFEDRNDAKNKIWKTCGLLNSSPVFRINIDTKSTILEGDHKITLTYVFQDNETNWHHSSNIFTFHVNTWTEEYEEWIFIFGNLIVPTFLFFIGVYITIYLHHRQKERKVNNENKTVHTKKTITDKNNNSFISNKNPHTENNANMHNK